MFYTFYREAIGTTRSLAVTGPQEDAVLQWRMSDHSGGAGASGEWHKIGPLGDVPDSVELRAPR